MSLQITTRREHNHWFCYPFVCLLHEGVCRTYLAQCFNDSRCNFAFVASYITILGSTNRRKSEVHINHIQSDVCYTACDHKRLGLEDQRTVISFVATFLVRVCVGVRGALTPELQATIRPPATEVRQIYMSQQLSLRDIASAPQWNLIYRTDVLQWCWGSLAESVRIFEQFMELV